MRGHVAVGLGRGEGLAELDRRGRGRGRGRVDVGVRGRGVVQVLHVLGSPLKWTGPMRHGVWRTGWVPGCSTSQLRVVVCPGSSVLMR